MKMEIISDFVLNETITKKVVYWKRNSVPNKTEIGFVATRNFRNNETVLPQQNFLISCRI